MQPAEVAPGVFMIRDTCNVYLIRSTDAATGETTAVAIDFGSGRALDFLVDLGITRITDVLMTHHHRDQGQGLPLAAAHGAAIHVPPIEVDLFRDVEEMWRTRQMVNDYNLRQDRFSLLESVPVASVVPLYRAATYGGVTVRPMPTPGHTLGSVSYVLDRDETRTVFTGDLIYGPGKVWSIAATQWSYSENEGPAMTVLSALLVRDENADVLLPSHGDAMHDPSDALSQLADVMQRYVDSRRPSPWELERKLRDPYVAVTPHLLYNAESMSTGYVLVSATGDALFIDFGYDMFTGLIGGGERSSRLPWLASLPALRANHGVKDVEVVLATHYHDDHVAGLELLRQAEGTQVWTPANVAPVLADPLRYDLPCLWWDPIPSDRVLPLGESFEWHEYTITVHELPGHTLYAAAFEVEVDGVVALFTGDQQSNEGRHVHDMALPNYQYRNLFRMTDYRDSAALYRRVAPGLLLSGHWSPRVFDEPLAEALDNIGQQVIDLHTELLPFDDLALEVDSIHARISPYRSIATVGASVTLTVELINPLRQEAETVVAAVIPLGWRSFPERVTRVLQPGERAQLEFVIQVGTAPVKRARIAADVSFGALHLGQHAEALIDIE